MARSCRQALVVQTASILAVASLISPGFGSPGDVLELDVPILGGEPPKARELQSGDLAVASETGALTYSYPISTPPGRLGVEPALSLQYNSQGSLAGGMAAHWSLAGLHEIRRDPTHSRLAQQSPDFVPRYVSTMGGGHQLIPVTEPALPDVTQTYRSQYDANYSRFERLGPGRWRVRTHDGSTHWFGEPPNASAVHINPAVEFGRADWRLPTGFAIV